MTIHELGSASDVLRFDGDPLEAPSNRPPAAGDAAPARTRVERSRPFSFRTDFGSPSEMFEIPGASRPIRRRPSERGPRH